MKRGFWFDVDMDFIEARNQNHGKRSSNLRVKIQQPMGKDLIVSLPHLRGSLRTTADFGASDFFSKPKLVVSQVLLCESFHLPQKFWFKVVSGPS